MSSFSNKNWPLYKQMSVLHLNISRNFFLVVRMGVVPRGSCSFGLSWKPHWEWFIVEEGNSKYCGNENELSGVE